MSAVRSLELFLLVSSLVLLLQPLRAKPGLGCLERERQALLHFKHGLVDDYGVLSSWDDGKDCCQWRGVTCGNRSGHVIMLLLPAPPTEFEDEYQSLTGEISPSLLQLDHLTHLDLSCNDFGGSPIPPFFASLTNMLYLNLSDANFIGSLPDELRNLSNLRSLDLSLNGDLHSGNNLNWLSHLSSLTHLDLSHVNLSKAIRWSQAIKELPSLVHLNLRECGLPPSLSLSPINFSAPLAFLDLSDNGCDLTSSVYPWLFNFSSTLVHLDLSWNDDLNRSIPEAFGSMISLEYLDISVSRLHGSIPEAFGNLSSLKSLQMAGNHLEGSIPNAIGHLSSLTYLDLSSNQLQGSIPYGLGSMNSLEYLSMSMNQLQGSIPDIFGNMTSSLTVLQLSENQLYGSVPDTVGKLAFLEGLYLSGNRLEGEIPKSLSNLCHLQELHLHHNNLSGQLPHDFLACANDTLEILYLSDNQLTGSVPHLTGFSSLIRLDLGYNKLNGTLSTSIGQLKNLLEFDVGSNSLQGAISEAHLLHLSQLYRLDLSSNSLAFNLSLEWVPPFQLRVILLSSCQLGPHFPSWLQTQKELKDLDISNSGISDAIPNWFWNLTSHIYYLNISNNHMRGTLPANLSSFIRSLYIDMSSNSFEGPIPQLPPYLAQLDFSHNKFSGSITLLCTVPNQYLVYLDLSNNLLLGEIPNCWSQWQSLTFLNLENNQFSGKIPRSFGSLQSIQTLHLRNNNLIGELPLSLTNCKNLSFIDFAKNRLSGRIFPWTRGSLPNLIVLNLGSNEFNGSICSELCQLKKIQILDLSNNNISGTIPRCLSNFTAMTKKGNLTIAYNYSLENSILTSPSWTYVAKELIKWKGREFEYKNTLGLVKTIDLSNNQLTGEIPKEVTDLLELVSLNFSRNKLTGFIPATIGQLKLLDVLDLSRNQLIGEIPTSLSEIDRLSSLDLSNNNLSGKIPKGTQLQSFNASTYEENPRLCGPPLLKKCPGDRVEGVPNISNHKDNVHKDGSDMWFYVSIALGFIVGFWGVCGTLVLNNSWRYAYFRFLNKINDWLYVTTTIYMARLRRSLQS